MKGAIKFCNIAEVAIEEKDVEKAHNNIRKVQNIIGYLQSTLDTKYPVAQDFINIYDYLSKRLLEANVKKDKEILEEVNMHLHSVRDNWKESCASTVRKGLSDGKSADDIVREPGSEAGGITEDSGNNKRQEEVFSAEKVDIRQSDAAVEEKQHLIDEVVRLDDGFEILYEKLAKSWRATDSATQHRSRKCRPR